MKLPHLSPRTKQFIIAMIAIPLFAACIGFGLFSPGPVATPVHKQTTQVSRTAKGGTPPVAHAPAPVTSRSDATAPGGAPVSPDTSTPQDVTNPPFDGPPAMPADTGRGIQTDNMTATELFQLLKNSPEKIAFITFQNGSNVVTVLKTGSQVRYSVTLPEQGGRQEVLKLAIEKNVALKAEEDSTSGFRSLLFSFGPFLLILVIYFVMMARQRGAGGMPGIGKARTKSTEDGGLRTETFKDVAGCDEAVKELRRIARGLRYRRLYSWFGAKLPRGILLVGPPGTGKTLLARALAGETDGTFDSTSGSDFVEMFVGVGASRVRDMFEKGRANVKRTGKPHIMFIDEIDAVGGRRGAPGESGGGNSEREQTLNALLVEMDGMSDNEGLIIIAATNRPEMLDEALLRQGRFDSQVQVDLPNKEGRVAIFGIHMRNKPVAQNVTADMLAERTYGYSGAEIAGACNRAALVAAERYGAQLPEDADEFAIVTRLKELGAVIQLTDFDEGIDFVRYGAANESRQKGMTDDEKHNTTVHEAGHAIASDAMPFADPIVKITMMNRSRALGYVQNMPSEDRYGYSFEQLVARIVTCMAGRAAQEIVLGKADTGASNDFEQGCTLAYRMVTLWGMSRLGIISVGRTGGGGLPGMGSGPIPQFGPKLADEIDDEWRRMVNECYLMARRIVETDRERLDKLVAQLHAEETILSPGWKKFREENPSKMDPKTLVLDISPVKKGE